MNKRKTGETVGFGITEALYDSLKDYIKTNMAVNNGKYKGDSKYVILADQFNKRLEGHEFSPRPFDIPQEHYKK